TLSQLGYMMMAMGVGAMTAGMFHLTTHAFFKSLLFLGAGSVIHAMHGEQDIWKMGNLQKKMPVTTWTFIIGALALAGIPPLSGFWSKDEILLGAYASGHYGLYILGAFVAFLTAFYMFRLIFVAFFGSSREGEHAHESPGVMTVPLVILAAAAVSVGFINSPLLHHIFGEFINSPAGIQPHPSNMIMISSSLIALAGIVLAWLIYQKEAVGHLALRNRFKGIYTLLLNKYYIDEIYAKLGEIFVYGGARAMYWFDIHVVNGLVDLVALVTGKSGDTLKYTENGQVQNYAMYMVAGALILVVLATMAAVSVIA
ncbi:MAG: proton-conducting transporter membrane subunit, partial [Syntrophomonadaceae bacterium]|nr:proton-conducting transporter membrane subunit [Syntrophomonadaceae bacterium]